jgi:hypothetical protein
MSKDLNELKQKYAELGEEIKRLEEAPKPWPQDGDEVFILGESGAIHSCIYVAGDWLDKALHQGNAFRTRAEAEAEKHYRDVAYELSQQEGARKFVNKVPNYCILYDSSLTCGLGVYTRYDHPDGRFSVYFETFRQAESAIAAVGEQEIIRAIRWKELGETS